MPNLPTGTVTFLFTDIEGSTRLWEQHPAAMRAATVRHDGLVEEIIDGNGGVLVRPRGEGDSRFAVFARASDAVAAAGALQRALTAEPWPTLAPVRVRMALHTGEADLRNGDYYGTTVNRCARLRAIAHGGQVLVSQVTCELVRLALVDGLFLRDVGEHRLQDLAGPEHVYQLATPGLLEAFPPLRSLDVLPNNLPLELTSFVGRERELAELSGRLKTTRLLTLTGAGGCGKTRLALQLGADVAESFPDGVWLVELAPLADAALVPDAVAAAVGARGGTGQPIHPALLAFLRTRRLLVILDNCENLLEACARLADAILRGCPNLRILATSREALGIAGEISWRVPSLTLLGGDRPMSLEAVAATETARLFVERAVAVQPAFALTEQNAPAVARICRRLDGIPLAIELAATRVRALSVEQIAGRLDQRFRLLTGGSRTALPRQQTLAATVSWSYDLLTEPEQNLFNRLSVFAGGFTLEAAEAICGVLGDGSPLREELEEKWRTGYQVLGEGTRGPDTRDLTSSPDVLDLLTSLVDKSLVVAETTDSDVGRYRLLETLRQYGRERLLATGEAERVQGRHAAYYLALAKDAAPHLCRPEQLAHLRRLDAVIDNARAALRWYLDVGDAVDGLSLANSMYWYWWYRGVIVEGAAWCAAFLRLPDSATPSLGRVQALDLAGWGLTLRGDLDEGRRMCAEALAMARDTKDDRTIGWVMLRVSAHGGPEKARWYGADERALGEGSLAHYRKAGDRWGISNALTRLGSLAVARGDLESARDLLMESLATARAVGDRNSIGWALEVQGECLSTVDVPQARAALEESVRLYQELGNVAGVVSVETFLGRLECLQGHYRAAKGHYQASLRVAKDWPWMERVVQSLVGLAMVAAGENRPEQAMLLAAAGVYWGEITGNGASPIEQIELDRALAPSRQAVGEGRVNELLVEGRAMSLDQAIDCALAM
jgi:predicted ATPase/class 3 adenylate cyclase